MQNRQGHTGEKAVKGGGVSDGSSLGNENPGNDHRLEGRGQRDDNAAQGNRCSRPEHIFCEVFLKRTSSFDPAFPVFPEQIDSAEKLRDKRGQRKSHNENGKGTVGT